MRLVRIALMVALTVIILKQQDMLEDSYNRFDILYSHFVKLAGLEVKNI